mmetsp:Transcript_13790/g.37368  ORF Transcript_13790/g.37368 Transcript_13790/m.37368 type:complete len:264 (-) Transcript_13790:473-1264(-)
MSQRLRPKRHIFANELSRAIFQGCQWPTAGVAGAGNGAQGKVVQLPEKPRNCALGGLCGHLDLALGRIEIHVSLIAHVNDIFPQILAVAAHVEVLLLPWPQLQSSRGQRRARAVDGGDAGLLEEPAPWEPVSNEEARDARGGRSVGTQNGDQLSAQLYERHRGCRCWNSHHEIFEARQSLMPRQERRRPGFEYRRCRQTRIRGPQHEVYRIWPIHAQHKGGARHVGVYEREARAICGAGPAAGSHAGVELIQCRYVYGVCLCR